MMSSYQQAMYAFWSGFEYKGKAIPAYLEGQVPDNTEYPYFTFEAPFGDNFGRSVLEAKMWMIEKNGVSVNAERAELFELIEKAIPFGGRYLTFEGGAAFIFRNDTGFCSPYDTGEEDNGRTVYAGRISYGIEYVY